MSGFLLVDQQAINLMHIVRAEFTAARPESTWYDDESECNRISSAEKAKLIITLTSQHSEEHVHDTDTAGYHVAASSENDLVIVRGTLAEEVWMYLEHVAIDPIEAMVPG